MANERFIPAGTVTMAAGVTSASALLPGGGDSAVIYNSTSSIAFVSFGTSTATASASSGYPVPPGSSRIVGIGSVANAVGVVLASGSGNVFVSQGTGSQY